MLQYQFRAIEQWPGNKTSERVASRFKSDFNKTLTLLEFELRMLDASSVVIQADCDASMIRNDGMLRRDARLRGPGVILSFDSKHGPLSYPCDTYVDWTHNLHAIALALEALRAVDRYGVTRSAEQYKGWARLPGPVEQQSMSVSDAAVILKAASKSGLPITATVLDGVYRRACAATHPDAGGSPESFKRVQEAKAVLDKHYGNP